MSTNTKMKNIFTLFLAALFSFSAYAGIVSDPKADPAAEVVCGNARFTVLTDRLIRMEWDEKGVFEDNASLAIINRRLPVPKFKVSRAGGGVTITTSSVVLKYNGEGKFSPENLSVTFKMNGRTV